MAEDVALLGRMGTSTSSYQLAAESLVHHSRSVSFLSSSFFFSLFLYKYFFLTHRLNIGRMIGRPAATPAFIRPDDLLEIAWLTRAAVPNGHLICDYQCRHPPTPPIRHPNPQQRRLPINNRLIKRAEPTTMFFQTFINVINAVAN